MSGKIDGRILKTKLKFSQALLKLIKHKPIYKVTIAELCKNSNLSRNTFYRYYDHPVQIIEDLDIEIFYNFILQYYEFCKTFNIKYLDYRFKKFLNHNKIIDKEKVKKFCHSRYDISGSFFIHQFERQKISQKQLEILSIKIFRLAESHRRYLKAKLSKHEILIIYFVAQSFVSSNIISVKTKCSNCKNSIIINKTNNNIYNFKMELIDLAYKWAKEPNRLIREKLFLIHFTKLIFLILN